MSEQKTLRFYLESSLLNSARAGTHNFINQVVSVAQAAGFDVDYHPDTLAERAASLSRTGYALFHMQPPTNDRGLCFRRVYHYPFWAIDPSAERWKWRVAKTPFDAEKTDPQQARKFYERWQNHLFGGAATRTSRDGFIYMPLQGRLTERRSFQLASPIEMIHATLRQDPKRRVVATLHPKEVYSRDEEKRLDHLQDRFANLTIHRGNMVKLLQTCDYVVTENSSAAFNGFFFGKPCLLFAKSDFHHITASVDAIGVERAFEQVQQMQPDFERYIYWFWQQMAINAGRKQAQTRIASVLRANGWPI